MTLLSGFLLFLLLLASAGSLYLWRENRLLRDRPKSDKQFGQYHLQAKIGQGGMGKVYRASHSLLRRPTAIKLLRADRESAESFKRFEREVRYTSGLTHPNTIQIYDYGHTPDGGFFYAMEYLQGVTLSHCISETGAQPASRVVYLMRQICGSIAEAHNTGLIHRDLKPSNIMICERGGKFDFIKVLDFGLVRSQSASGTQGVTNIQTLTGTPMYLSPEAISDPEAMDARSDIYQLGAIAYFMLTGQHVFSGNNLYEICAHHLNTVPDMPSTKLNRPVNHELEVLIMGCLAKQPEKRPGTAQQLLTAFEKLAQSEQIGYWTQQEARSWWHLWLEEHQEMGSLAVDSDRELSVSGPSVIDINMESRDLK